MRFDKKILLLSTYPIEESLHGGQKRVKAIRDFYVEKFDDVKFVAVFHKKFFDKYGRDDIPIEDPLVINKIEKSPFVSDMISGDAIYDDKKVRQRIKALLLEYKPDIIEFEQIYPFSGFEKVLKETNLNSKLILNSQNNETLLKESILSGIGVTSETKQALLGKIKELEEKITKRVDLVIAVNESDAADHVKLGAKKCIVAPNGIEKVEPTPAAIAHWQKFKREHGVEKLVTFVGSAHPPNLIGFQEMIGQNLEFLPAKTCIMLAGGVSNYIQQEYGSESATAKRFWKRAWPLGNLSDDNLAGLIQESEVIILPIVRGVGSNLKTAEALLADKKVVATNLAFRTFEQYSNLPNIYFADTQETFKKSIVTALNSSKIKRTPEQTARAQKVQWRYCLTPINDALSVMLKGKLRTKLGQTKKYLKRKINR